MDAMRKLIYFILILVYTVIKSDAVTVNPALCPTNKIAPHRRHARWEQSRPRTLGLIYELLTPPRRPPVLQNDPLDVLQEQPQEDDSDDCGEIEDYDETDLSSVTQGAQRRKQYRENRYLFGDNYVLPSYYPVTSKPVTPSRPYRPQRPTRPTYSSQGTYGSNVYRPPLHQYGSDYIKPVTEDILDSPQVTYRPGLIGGTHGHIVGFPSVKLNTEVPPPRRSNTSFRFPENDSNINNRKKKSQQTTSNKSTNIIYSFVDLLFN